MTEQFKFTEVKLQNLYENLTTAIGLIQTYIIAGDSCLNDEVLFGKGAFYRDKPLSAALALLVPMIDEVDGLVWPTGEDFEKPKKVE